MQSVLELADVLRLATVVTVHAGKFEAFSTRRRRESECLLGSVLVSTFCMLWIVSAGRTY